VSAFRFIAAWLRGPESERRGQPEELHLGDFAQSGQDVVDPEPLPKGVDGRLTTGEQIGEQTQDQEQCRMHRLQATTYPAQCPGQLDIEAQLIGRGLSTRGLLDGYDDLFELLQGAREAGGKAIGQQAEGTVTLRAVPTRNPAPGWIDPLVGAMAGERATPCRMQWAALQGCILPGLAFNVLAAGEVCFEAQLHRPPARTAATVAGHSFV
jgi:hypothetical protein